MSSTPPAKNHGILSYDLHPSVDHTTLEAVMPRGVNSTQQHQSLRVVQPNGDDYTRLEDRVKNVKRLKRKNTELEEELVADAPPMHLKL
ncbi:hypothetical protein EDD16DRAFT_1699925 [Pisolithus croceorrhizus]|nr:hypothetical protein EDD16DRAFT_1699925 [Pisolithus croceorrhizus]